jgi:hypothetical protein
MVEREWENRRRMKEDRRLQLLKKQFYPSSSKSYGCQSMMKLTLKTLDDLMEHCKAFETGETKTCWYITFYWFSLQQSKPKSFLLDK